MLRGLYTGGQGWFNEQKRLDVISNNLANADTLGYKQESVSSQSFDKIADNQNTRWISSISQPGDRDDEPGGKSW